MTALHRSNAGNLLLSLYGTKRGRISAIFFHSESKFRQVNLLKPPLDHAKRSMICSRNNRGRMSLS